MAVEPERSLRADCLGIVETEGLVPAIEAADRMLKSGDVNLLCFWRAGEGRVAVIVQGDTGPVQAAVKAGADAAARVGKVHGKNVVPRCRREVVDLLLKSACPHRSDETVTVKEPKTQ